MNDRSNILRHWLFSLGAIFGGIALSYHANAQVYVFRDLGTLGGKESAAYDINDLGQIVGYSTTAGESTYHATLWTVQGGAPLDLGVSSGYSDSVANAINNSGLVAGRNLARSGWEDATIWSDGTATVVRLGSDASTASGVNNFGQVLVAGYGGGTAIWQNGSLDLLPINSSGFQAPGLNDAGEVVFNLNAPRGNAALWSGGTVTDLGALYDRGSLPLSINNSGQVVGDSIYCGACNDRATLWENGNIIDLGTLGGADSVALDINDAGFIVGNSKTSEGVYHATLWSDGSIFDLNSFLDAGAKAAGWVLAVADGINQRGSIVGSATNTLTGERHAFVMDAVPELSSGGAMQAIALSLAGVLVIAGRKRAVPRLL